MQNAGLCDFGLFGIGRLTDEAGLTGRVVGAEEIAVEAHAGVVCEHGSSIAGAKSLRPQGDVETVGMEAFRRTVEPPAVAIPAQSPRPFFQQLRPSILEVVSVGVVVIPSETGVHGGVGLDFRWNVGDEAFAACLDRPGDFQYEVAA